MSAPRWVRPFLIVAIAMAIPPLFYWRIYLPQSLKAAQDQSYSTLGAVAREVSQRLKGYDLV
ncbi:MAG TPA: hypothetical protein VMR50_12550, partial [Myxococcota bacterium]|nr:hypothetical protein [Myxococcota bacterium]